MSIASVVHYLQCTLHVYMGVRIYEENLVTKQRYNHIRGYAIPKSSQYHHVSKSPWKESSWVCIVKRKWLGTFDNEFAAAMRADEYVLELEATDQVKVGKLKLNFPDKWPSLHVRKRNANRRALIADGCPPEDLEMLSDYYE